MWRKKKQLSSSIVWSVPPRRRPEETNLSKSTVIEYTFSSASKYASDAPARCSLYTPTQQTWKEIFTFTCDKKDLLLLIFLHPASSLLSCILNSFFVDAVLSTLLHCHVLTLFDFIIFFYCIWTLTHTESEKVRQWFRCFSLIECPFVVPHQPNDDILLGFCVIFHSFTRLSFSSFIKWRDCFCFASGMPKRSDNLV